MASAPGADPDRSGAHMQATVDAFTAALGSRVRPRGPGFADLFTDDAVLEVPFEGDGGAPAIRGRAAIEAVVVSLVDVLHFHRVAVTSVMEVDAQGDSEGDGAAVLCEYEASLDRYDLGQRFHRRYVGLFVLRDGLVSHLREFGGPLVPDLGAGARPHRPR